MKVREAEVLLAELAKTIAGANAEVGTKGVPPYDFAYLKLTSIKEPDDFAIVSTRGDGWFEFEVSGGFYTGSTSDMTSDEHVREYLEEYLAAALAYIAGNRKVGKSRLFRIPFVSVETGGRLIKLHR